METDRPMGRVRDVFRVACACGKAAPKWSVSDFAAIRLWNEIIATENSG